MHKELLQKGIIQTLGFFALFDRPLTKEEVIQYFFLSKEEVHVLLKTLSTLEGLKEEIARMLHEMPHIHKQEKYYYLEQESPQAIEETYLQNSQQLLEKCQRYLPVLRHVPFVRMVGVGNTLAFGGADNDSDIDLLIVAEGTHVWLVRFLSGLLYQILGVRRHGSKVAGRFCLSFYIDTEVRDFQSIMLKPEDIYMRFWIGTLKPFVGEKEYEEFIDANAAMLSESFPLWAQEEEKKFLHTRVGGRVQKILEAFFHTRIGIYLEKKITSIQKKKMEILPVKLTHESSVVVTDHMLKFHNKDRRALYGEEWRNILRKYDL